MATSPVRTVTAVLLAALAGPVAAADPYDLMKYVPSPVNTVAVVNVSNILQSPPGEKGGWAKLHHTEYLAGAVPVNPAVERMLLATEFVPSQPGHGGGLAVVSMKTSVDLAKIAPAQGGQIVTVGGEKVIDTPDGRFFAPLGPQLLGAMRTDNRQDVTRWMRYAKTADRSVLSPYLNRSVSGFGDRFHILVAVDTEDLFHPDQLRAAVAASKIPEAGKPASDAVERFIAGMNGVRFTANVTDRGIESTLRVDSTVRSDGVPPDLVKGFVIETLAKNGATLADLGAATARAEGLTVILSFVVSDAELAKVMSLFVTAAAGLSQGDVIPVTPTGTNPAATRTYFRAVNRILDDLRGRKTDPIAADDPDKAYAKSAVWYDTAANRIATLPVLNVDPIALDYGRSAAGRLQAMAKSLRGVPLKAQALEDRAYAYRSGGGWGWGWGGGAVTTNVPQIELRIRDTIDQDRGDRMKLWAEADKDRAKAREALAAKYGADFDPASPAGP